jgi:hypothetical protein
MSSNNERGLGVVMKINTDHIYIIMMTTTGQNNVKIKIESNDNDRLSTQPMNIVDSDT